MTESNQTTNGASTTETFTFEATYQSPTNEAFSCTRTLPAPAADKVREKTSYLSALRKAVVEIQEQINKELTARMEEDKAREGAASKGPVDEAKEEDNYGEEVVEEN
ncbi:hypothetical protein G7Y89_g10827 [Cudoniella acicularis]|uniref:EKC/KEOPS complex subunit GON7 n=1 Tax=Cudoniella acicularis TaxID=354080 RepID=A0A8H4VYM4_9HELO|nr:hypothetical protein G7Y89_g10827 [Cudoniella acicularis]